jgi:hypothetical protein
MGARARCSCRLRRMWRARKATVGSSKRAPVVRAAAVLLKSSTAGRWDDATGSNLYEHLAGVNDLLLARATSTAAVKRRPHAKITLRNGARIMKRPGRRTIEQAAWPARQREKRSGGGAWGQRLGNHLDAGGAGADCPSVPSGFAPSVESGIGGFFGGIRTVCGRSSLCAVSFSCGCRLLGSFGVFSGGTTGVAAGKSSAIMLGPLGSFSDSTQRKKASLSSSMAAHPARPKFAGTAIETSATRA